MLPEPTDKLPRSAWHAAIRFTVVLIALAIVLSVIVTAIIRYTASGGMTTGEYVIAVVMPIIIGTPGLFLISLGRQRLKHANAQLARLASIDTLTDCLNRRAFTHEVEARLGIADARREGALLMIDADHFKLVNDRFGHERGDEALQLIAAAIRRAVRAGDLVGRMGGEEFSVFLGHADIATATAIAEGIRTAITAQVFAPGGQVHPLSVSIGGATFTGAANLSELYRLADARLYDVKGEQRGHVKLAAAA